MTEIKQYSERDAMELDEVGGHYFRHVLAMTAEGLHSKSDIAAELGWRDMQISALHEQVRALAAENENLKVACGGDGNYIDCPGCSHSQYIESPDTPATDAAIREIRAQAVERVADSGEFSMWVQQGLKVWANRFRAEGEQP